LGEAPIRIVDPRAGAGGVGGTAGVGDNVGGAGGRLPVSGVLEVLAGQLGGPGNLDGVGPAARFLSIADFTFDPDDDRVFVTDYTALRAVDGETGRVTTLDTNGMAAALVRYQRGSLYLCEFVFDNAAGQPPMLMLTPMSPTTGQLGPTSVASLPSGFSASVVAWPTDDAFFQVSSEGKLMRLDPKDGSVTVVPLTGFPASDWVDSAVMRAPGTMLVALGSRLGDGTFSERIVSIDISSAVATPLTTIPPGFYVMGLDPDGQFVVLSDGSGTESAMAIGPGTAPSFSVGLPMVRGPHGDLLFMGNYGIRRWDRASPASVAWAGLDRPAGPENLGPATGVIFSGAPLAISTSAGKAYLTWALQDGLAVVDVAAKEVSSWTQAHAVNAAAALPTDGGLIVSERSDCSIWQLAADPSVPDVPIWPASASCRSNGGNPTNPANHNFARPALAWFDGALVFGADAMYGLLQIDPVTHTSTRHLFYDRNHIRELDYIGISSAAVASDGLLYVSGGGSLMRIDHGFQTATVLGPAGGSVAADRDGHVYTTLGDSVWRWNIATGQGQPVVGVDGAIGITLGPLPGTLNKPQGLAVTDDGDLLIGNGGEYAVLRAHFQ